MHITFETLANQAEPLLEQIKTMPFNVELANGTLAQEKFLFYLEQDALYINHFAKALTIAAAKLHNNTSIQRFLHFALESISAECNYHSAYINDHTRQIQTIQPSPSCFMYTNYLLQTVNMKSIQEAIAAVLPCFWVYKVVGEHVLAIAQKAGTYAPDSHPYFGWIDLYTAEKFHLSTSQAIEIFNEIAVDVSPQMMERITDTFMTATKLEWLFWDSAYRLETWRI